MSAAATEVLVGLDLGTTSSKALVRDIGGRQLALARTQTPWSSVDGGTQTSAQALLHLATGLIERAVLAAEREVGALRVLGVGVAGLAESGVLLDAAGEPCAPVIAWFDPRGMQQLGEAAKADPWLAQQFPRRTGLPWDSQTAFAKLLWLGSRGLTPTPAHRWSSIPEWVVHRLGGRLVREPSLASRTGLVDQATGGIWSEAFAASDLPTTLLPPAATAGTSVGRLRHPTLPGCLQGAALTVAGHDHPVAAIGAGATGKDALFNSAGTADVLARSLPGSIDDDRREVLVRRGLSVGAHVLPDTTLLLGGVRGGLLLRRVLAALGAAEAPERDSLDAASLAVDVLPDGLDVCGVGPTGDDVVLRLRDGVTPAAIWAAATRHTAAQTRALLAVIDDVVGPYRSAVASGGWTGMQSVRLAKQSAIDHLQFSTQREPGAVGAAVLAAEAAGAGCAPASDLPTAPLVSATTEGES